MAIPMNRDRILTRHSNIVHRQANYVGPQIRQMIAIVNTAVMAPAAVEAKSPDPSSSLRHHSDDDTHNERPWDVVSGGEPC
jgi:hypothetical protein